MARYENGKDGEFAADNPNGKRRKFHDIDSGGVYGTHEYEVKSMGSFAPDLRVEHGLGGAALRKKKERKFDTKADDFLRSMGFDPDKL